MSLSFCSSLTQSLSDEEWEEFKKSVFAHFPFFKRVNGASGSQSQTIPFFTQSRLDLSWIKDRLIRILKEMNQSLHALLTLHTSPRNSPDESIPPV